MNLLVVVLFVIVIVIVIVVVIVNIDDGDKLLSNYIQIIVIKYF